MDTNILRTLYIALLVLLLVFLGASLFFLRVTKEQLTTEKARHNATSIQLGECKNVVGSYGVALRLQNATIQALGDRIGACENEKVITKQNTQARFTIIENSQKKGSKQSSLYDVDSATRKKAADHMNKDW